MQDCPEEEKKENPPQVAESIFTSVLEEDWPKKRKQSTLFMESHFTFGFTKDSKTELIKDTDVEDYFSEVSFKNEKQFTEESNVAQKGSEGEEKGTCQRCPVLIDNLTKVYKDHASLQKKNDRLTDKNRTKKDKMIKMAEIIKSLRENKLASDREHAGMTEELAQSKNNLEVLMTSAKDVKQMLDDTINVKLRYELIIKNLL